MPIFKNYTSYKIAGQILFWICSLIFAITAFYVASNHKLGLNNDLILRALIPNIGFAISVYVNLYILIPKYLKNKNYIYYTFGLILILAFSSFLIQLAFAYILTTQSFSTQFSSLFSSHFFTALFYVGITSLFKFLKDWIQLQEMKLKFVKIEREKLEAELNTLKSQLNPHFLFNCLNNIYSMALTNSPETPEIILKLSDLMRHVLYESRENFISVKKELDFLVNFIELQKIRLSNAIEIKYSLLGDIPDRQVMPLIFEPFIDNAFKHGLRQQAPSPYIHVTVAFQSELMRFKICNNYRRTYSPIAQETSGVGLKNIEKRLEYLYLKSEYTYNVTQTEDTFTVQLEVQLKK